MPAELMQGAKRRTVLFAAPFLSTGAALLVYILSGLSLLVTAFLVLVGATVFGVVIWRQLPAPSRVVIQRTLCIGVLSGLLATAAYDVSRWVLIAVTGIQFWPFDIFAVFGRALFGADYTGWWVEAAGFAYHLANGIGFAIAYTLVWGHRGVWGGIGWAFVLEGLMVSVYPGWLELKALQEFLQVSIFGHVIYGAVLGDMAQRLLVYYQRQNDGRE
jgi:hypothetical protein